MSSATAIPNAAVSISYQTLISSPHLLKASIEDAFGSHPNSLGIIIVHDLPPSFMASRERLLKLSYKFANLDAKVRESHADPKSRYSFGWSHGKEIMNGKPDFLKGSYYANPVVDQANVSQELKEGYPEYYGNNIWPNNEVQGIEGFEEAFKDLGSFVFKVGCQLAVACQPFVSSNLRDSSLSLPDMINSSQTTKARLLHYYPPPPTEVDSEGAIDDWCGFHLDHSLLTGLCSAMYLREEASEPVVVSSPAPTAGLYIRTRGGDLTQVSIPAGCLAFQTGEALELATSGRLRATPHCVRVGKAKAAGPIHRETFVVFMQPNVDQRISAEETFGQFSKRIFDQHYESVSM